MTVKESLILNEDFYSLAFFGHYKQTDESLQESLTQQGTITKLDSLLRKQSTLGGTPGEQEEQSELEQQQLDVKKKLDIMKNIQKKWQSS